MEYIWIAFGVLGLYFGGECLVKGAVGLSLRYGIPPMIVGLTVVAFGTSAPELIVSLRSALTGHGGIAFGNVIGSNIANILLILGVPALISPIATDECDGKRAWFEMMFASILFVFLVMLSPFGWKQGVILLAVFIFIILSQFMRARSGKICLDNDVEQDTSKLPMWNILAFLAIGVFLLPLGADRLVFGAVIVAKDMGVPESIIGLTIFAIGTSLPELAPSLTAAIKGETDMAIGNVIGSNLFNILLVLGVTGIATQSHIDYDLIKIDLPIMIGVSMFIGIFVVGRIQITRLIGAGMVFAYLTYLTACIL